MAAQQRLDKEREFLASKQALTEEFGLKAIELQEQIAEKEVDVTKQKTDALIALERKRRDVALEFTEELSSRVTALVTGQIEDFEEFSRELLLLTLDAIEKTVLLYAAQATAREVGTKGFAGIATGAILAGIIKATFAGIKGIVKRFEEGGDITGGGPAFDGGAVPPGGGLVQLGNRHAQKGIPGIAPDGQPVEIERGEFVMRNGPYTHIVKRDNARRFSGYLAKVQSSFPADRFNSRRASIAQAVNALSFREGGTLPSSPPLVPPVLPRVVNTAAATSATVDAAADSAVNNAMIIDLIQAVNRRIDRITVVNDPSQTVRNGNVTIAVEDRNKQ